MAIKHDDRGKWLALAAALLGWMFDGFEIGMFPLVGQNALNALLPNEPATVKNDWFAVIMSVFLIGAATGGVLFGWLGDRLGRVRAMSLSIFTYAIFTGLCGVVTEAWQLAVLRFIASLGMGGEWALGVALINELWSDRSRAFLAGLMGAAANVGILLVGLVSLVVVKFIAGVGESMRAIGVSDGAVASLLDGDGWRLMMILGAIPALLIFFIRMFVPESHKWEAQRDAGGTSHWATRDLLGVLAGAVGAMGVVTLWSPIFDSLVGVRVGEAPRVVQLPDWALAVRLGGTAVGLIGALVGFLYPVVKYLRRAEAAGALPSGDRPRYVKRMLFGACLSAVALLGTWGSLQWAPKWSTALAAQLPASAEPVPAKEHTQIASAFGAIVGAILAALAAGRYGRRITYAALCVLSFGSLVYMYQGNDAYGAKFLASVFLAGGFTAAFYGWFPLYLPELFPTSIRATAQGFAYNFGRVLSAIGALQTATLTTFFARGVAEDRVALDAFPKAGATLAAIYLIGVLIIWLGPETKGQPLPE